MRTIRLVLLLTVFAFAQPLLPVPQNFVCPVTKAPVEAFVPPLPWHPHPRTDTTFQIGTPGLWAHVSNHWTLNQEQNKLPYFSERYDWTQMKDPALAVVARRLDAPAPLVWAKWVNGAGPSYKPEEGLDPSRRDGFMVTGLAIPNRGCWEISAHLTDVRDKVETLTYTVLVD